MSLKNLGIDESWSLFLDRDGVINKKLPEDYVKNWNEFTFLDKVPETISSLTKVFGKIFIVTNQQGIGKGIMTERDLDQIHDRMMEEIRYAGGKINKIYYSPYRVEEKSVFRKPNVGMARKAKIDFPEIDFDKSIMAGDSITDMEFGKNAGMITVFISEDKETRSQHRDLIDYFYPDLQTLTKDITEAD